MWWMDRRKRVCIIPNNFMNVKCKCTVIIFPCKQIIISIVSIQSMQASIANRGERGRHSMIIHVADIWRDGPRGDLAGGDKNMAGARSHP